MRGILPEAFKKPSQNTLLLTTVGFIPQGNCPSEKQSCKAGGRCDLPPLVIQQEGGNSAGSSQGLGSRREDSGQL